MSSYKLVSPSGTDESLAGVGQVGKKGNLLKRVIVIVDTVGAGGAASIKDGSTSISLTPASAPIGTYTLEIDAPSQTGAWTATTGANATIIAVGDFG